MKHIIEKIKSAVQTNPAHFYSDSVEPILDTLYWHYCEDVGIETPESKTANSNFNAARWCMAAMCPTVWRYHHLRNRIYWTWKYY